MSYYWSILITVIVIGKPKFHFTKGILINEVIIWPSLFMLFVIMFSHFNDVVNFNIVSKCKIQNNVETKWLKPSHREMYDYLLIFYYLFYYC